MDVTYHRRTRPLRLALRGGSSDPIRAIPGRGDAESWVEEILGERHRPAIDPLGLGGCTRPGDVPQSP
jgi:hypothetical protein